MRRSGLAETDDQELISLAAAGNREAFGHLYERHKSRVFRHAFFLTGDALLAEDLTAQTFLNALQAITRYQARGVPFVAWLLRITCNLTINYKKSLKNSGHAQLPEALEAEDPAGSPEDFCELKDDGDRVWREVRHLPYEQRQVIVMRFIDDLSYQDIAQILGKSVGAVRVIQFRALSNLRHMLDSAPPPGATPAPAKPRLPAPTPECSGAPSRPPPVHLASDSSLPAPGSYSSPPNVARCLQAPPSPPPVKVRRNERGDQTRRHSSDSDASRTYPHAAGL